MPRHRSRRSREEHSHRKRVEKTRGPRVELRLDRLTAALGRASLASVARATGINARQLRRYRDGKHATAHLHVVERIARAVGYSSEDLIRSAEQSTETDRVAILADATALRLWRATGDLSPNCPRALFAVTRALMSYEDWSRALFEEDVAVLSLGKSWGFHQRTVNVMAQRSDAFASHLAKAIGVLLEPTGRGPKRRITSSDKRILLRALMGVLRARNRLLDKRIDGATQTMTAERIRAVFAETDRPTRSTGSH